MYEIGKLLNPRSLAPHVCPAGETCPTYSIGGCKGLDFAKRVRQVLLCQPCRTLDYSLHIGLQSLRQTQGTTDTVFVCHTSATRTGARRTRKSISSRLTQPWHLVHPDRIVSWDRLATSRLGAGVLLHVFGAASPGRGRLARAGSHTSELRLALALAVQRAVYFFTAVQLDGE